MLKLTLVSNSYNIEYTSCNVMTGKGLPLEERIQALDRLLEDTLDFGRCITATHHVAQEPWIALQCASGENR